MACNAPFGSPGRGPEGTVAPSPASGGPAQRAGAQGTLRTFGRRHGAWVLAVSGAGGGRDGRDPSRPPESPPVAIASEDAMDADAAMSMFSAAGRGVRRRRAFRR